ncbi:uncharacterized protein J4E88_000113 [Alternaria novae-zelandiae]|uniref:uncharacterized protein n=1 Tax=Alternaria novae-zelandiae TaxID=430562 RepID=UPI0020C4257E|nr:uncharacterized protein J4E88_000113 [Alternaria novae-zelandiae]KAI4695943.1 hypothetical protein J4E88_000113 [Alternaria novae-zelandiae]
MSLTGLPRELRDAIYIYYVTEEDGYHYDLSSGKLRTSTNERIDTLSLMHVCKGIASEMRGVHFVNNTVHFSTTPLPTDRGSSRARHHGYLLEDLYTAKRLVLPWVRQYISNDIAQRVIDRFPKSEALLRHLMSTKRRICQGFEQLGKSGDWGQAPSFHRDTIDELLNLVAQTPAVGELTRKVLERQGFRFRHEQNVASLYQLHPIAWRLPNKQESKIVEDQSPIGPHNPWRERVRDRTRYYISAASQAADFLSKLQQQHRVHIRSVDLHETHAAISYPECHARALIPFAIENPKLKIIRYADLWGGVLTSLQSARFEEHRSDPGQGVGPMRTMYAWELTKTIAPWLMEAMALHPAGMPAKCFTLVFKGEPELMQPILDIVIEDAAWQDALQTKSDRQEQPPVPDRSGTGYKRHSCYQFEGFPGLMRDVIAGNGSIQFNNCSAQGWDIEELFEANPGCSDTADWNEAWQSMRLQAVVPPAPQTWDAILSDYVQEKDDA